MFVGTGAGGGALAVLVCPRDGEIVRVVDVPGGTFAHVPAGGAAVEGRRPQSELVGVGVGAGCSISIASSVASAEEAVDATGAADATGGGAGGGADAAAFCDAVGEAFVATSPS